MASAIAFIKWESYAGESGAPALFDAEPLSFNSRQERLHNVEPGARVWLVSRKPDDQQYYFVAVLSLREHRRNAPGTPLAEQFGEYAIVADRARSHSLGTSFPAEALLRALDFETGKPIRYGASIGQSLQAIRTLTDDDAMLLDGALARAIGAGGRFVDAPAGIWTKCAAEFAVYFQTNWERQRKPLAFMLYDSPPELASGAPIFIHSDKNLRLVARFLGTQFVAGHKFTVDEAERLAERERIWATFREPTVNPPIRAEYERFFAGQHGVRSLFLMDEVLAVSEPLPFKSYGRALEWGYPTGVGYRYLTLTQCFLLLRGVSLSEAARSLFLTYLNAAASGMAPRTTQ